MQDQPKYFCFVTINSQTSMIIESAMIILSVALIADAFRKFWKMRGSHNSHVTKMYILILLWWITFVVSSGYCIINYFFAWQSEQYSDEQMSHLSKYSFLLNWGNAYVIQSILLLVPYHWSKQITGLFSQVERGSEVAVEDAEQFRGLDRYVYFTLKWYTRLRLIFLGLPVVFILLQDSSTILLTFKVMMSALLMDCVFIALSLIMGMISLKTTKELKQQIDEEQSGRMVNQYLMIITANTIRFGFDLYYVIGTLITTDSFVYAHCPDKTQNIDLGYQLTTNILTCFFSHFLPIFIILRIYNLEEKPEEMCKSLLITTSDS